NAPAEHAEAVDHGGVRICSDQSVRISSQFAIDPGRKDDAGEILEIHLVADAHAGRHGTEVAKGRLAPLEKRITFAVALKLQQRVGIVRTSGAEFVHLHGVVDDEFGGHKRIHALGIATERLDGIAHSAEVNDGGDAGEVLHQDAGWHVGDFAARLGLGVPAGEELNVSGGHVHAVFSTQQVLEQDLQAEGQPVQVEA